MSLIDRILKPVHYPILLGMMRYYRLFQTRRWHMAFILFSASYLDVSPPLFYQRSISSKWSLPSRQMSCCPGFINTLLGYINMFYHWIGCTQQTFRTCKCTSAAVQINCLNNRSLVFLMHSHVTIVWQYVFKLPGAVSPSPCVCVRHWHRAQTTTELRICPCGFFRPPMSWRFRGISSVWANPI